MQANLKCSARLTRRVLTNRTNAKKSCGPRSANGKMRSSQNAKRHGLATAITTDPLWHQFMQRIFKELKAGCSKTTDCTLLINIAESVSALARIRNVRCVLMDELHQLITEKRRTENCNADELQQLLIHDPIKLLSEAAAEGRLVKAKDRSIKELTLQLSRLERYERRAHSRMKILLLFK